MTYRCISVLCYQCAISGCVIRCGVTVHITLIECMSRVCELISDDPYAVFQYVVEIWYCQYESMGLQ